MSISLYEHQQQALEKLRNGSVLCGGVGSGKSRTAIAYYFVKECGGRIDGKAHGYSENYVPMENPKDLYIITTAQKRDKKEWEAECIPFLLIGSPDICPYSIKVTVDSWNNIAKYKDVTNSFFIFDEQRVVGYGKWSKTFIRISRRNHWILLSATPGDTWMDYIPVFIANGYYRNKTDFVNTHVVYAAYSKFPKVERYMGERHLEKLREQILVNMDYHKPAQSHHIDILTEYDRETFKDVIRRRWNIYEDKPIVNSAELFYLMRKVVNSSPARAEAIRKLADAHPKAIIFYNFDYELEILRAIPYADGTVVAEWNGHRHEQIPKAERWVYLVQYSAGAEGWNCIETDTTIFYSQNYSYKILVQASGRIDRLNTPYKDLYFYHLKSRAWIDAAIARALKAKKNFNERSYKLH